MALLLLFFLSERTLAQISDDFSDGNFTDSPPWSGLAENFVVNSDLQLQLNAPAAGISWLSTACDLNPASIIEWEILVKQSFAPSGTNFGRIYLMSDQPDLSGDLNGYFIQFGEPGSEDAIGLFRQSGSAIAPVCRGTNATIAGPFETRVKVVRTPDGAWDLYADHSGGRNFTREASGIDLMHLSPRAFGVMCTYTITNASRFSYDDIFIRQSVVPDNTGPGIIAVEVTSPASLRVVFSEDVIRDSAEVAANYHVVPHGGAAAQAALQTDLRTVALTFSESFGNGFPSTLTVANATDTAGNTTPLSEMPFVYFQPSSLAFGDIVFSELLPDPTPVVGLPESEFIELLNRSDHPVLLEGWTLTDGTATATLPAYIVLPGDYVLICPPPAAAAFASFASTLAPAGFPSLNNAGDHLLLADPHGLIVDSLRYTGSWYRDEAKSSGGWTLERIDPENFCEGDENWTASIATTGGTPGRQNSVHRVVADTVPPALLHGVRRSDQVVELIFDERLSADIPLATDFAIAPPADIINISFGNPGLTTLELLVSPPLDTALSYQISVQNVRDCRGNVIHPDRNTAWLKGDTLAPAVISVAATSVTALIVNFSEPVSATTAGITYNYYLEGTGHPVSIVQDPDRKMVTLRFSPDLRNGEVVVLKVENISDLAGNVMPPSTLSFLYFTPQPVSFRDIVFTEVLPDPVPSAGLPEAEFVEIYNRSKNPVDLSGWTLSDGTTTARLDSFLLRPDHYLVITSAANAERFSLPMHLSVAGVRGFPSLNNGGDQLALKESSGRTIDSISYAQSWFRDDEKADGGWSLELVDPDNICAEERNWTASEAVGGGTPGHPNSVRASMPDRMGPRMTGVMATGASRVLVNFDEKLDEAVPSPGRFVIDPHRSVRSAAFYDASLRSLLLLLGDSLTPGVRYSLTVSGIVDCPGNLIQEMFSSATFVLPERADPNDIVINEVLFNPRPTGVDFVELFNRSAKAIDLKDWTLHNPHGNTRNSLVVLTTDHLLMLPGSYRVFTPDTQALQHEYVAAAGENFIQTELPSLNDDFGASVVLDPEGRVIDSAEYREEWHSPFLRDAEGTSLERIAPDQGSTEPANWRSASAASGFATPGYVNSNYRDAADADEGSVDIEPEIIRSGAAPQDFTRISYRFARGGFVANVAVFDAEGRTVREISSNELLGTHGTFRWDGDLDNGTPARTGYYMIWFQIFNEQGVVKTFRRRVAVY